jgi:hypothetical protein
MNSFVQFLKTNVVENIKSDFHIKARFLGTGDKSAEVDCESTMRGFNSLNHRIHCRLLMPRK